MSVSRASRLVPAPPQTVYAAFLDPAALAAWLPPGEMSGEVHAFESGVGGGYEMSLYYPDSEPTLRGKTADREDRVRVRFAALEPPERIVETVRFVTDDPALRGEMTLIIDLTAASGGTEVTLTFVDLPPGVRREDNDLGARQSLDQLAAWFGRC